MTSVLGKRKSRAQTSQPSTSEKDAQDVFQRYFEAQFEPLLPGRKSSQSRQPGDDTATQFIDQGQIECHHGLDESESEESWSGVSDSTSSSRSQTPEIEVVSHVDDLPKTGKDPTAQKESRNILSSRVPSSAIASNIPSSSAARKNRPQGAADNPTTEEDAPTLLKNDLALQRLLSESHLFAQSASNSSGKGMEHMGRNRHLATDMRLQALGSRSSVFSQAKMPMSHRKGIAAAATSREAKRRRDARDNDIILERPSALTGGTKTKKKAGAGSGNRRERAVDAPAVGTMQHGMLKLSKRDVAEIENSGGRGSSKRSGAAKGKRVR